MKVARFHAPGDIRDRGRARARRPGPARSRSGCATARPAAPTSRSSSYGHQHITPPRVMGHEIAGEVVEVGDGRRRGWAVGDRVQVIAADPVRRLRGVPAGLDDGLPEPGRRWATTTTAASPST